MASNVTMPKRGSIHIWANQKTDDSSSVSSLSSAFVPGDACSDCSSLCSSSDNDCCSDYSFDLSLLPDDDTDSDNGSETSISVKATQLKEKVGNDQHKNTNNNNFGSDWRWESDPSLTVQRVLGKSAVMPLKPLRRWSSKSSRSRSLSLTTAAKKLLQTQKDSFKAARKSSPRIDRKKIRVANRNASSSISALLQTHRPRMPRRQLSNASSKLLDSVEASPLSLLTPEQELEVAKPNTEPTLPDSPISSPPLRLRRFHVDIPTRQKKLPSSSRRVVRLTRACRLPARRRSGNGGGRGGSKPQLA